MKKNNDEVAPVKSSLCDYIRAHRRRKESVSHAKEHINMIAETLLDLSEKDSDCLMAIKLSMMSEIFKSFVNDIDNGVSDKQAVKSFTNNLGITTSNARPSYDTISAYTDIDYEYHNTFSWLENGVVVRKIFNDGSDLKGLTTKQKELLPKDFKFHPRKSLTKSIEIIAKKYFISPNTLKAAYLAARKESDILAFENERQMYLDDLEDEGLSKEEVSRIIDNFSFDIWMKDLAEARKKGKRYFQFSGLGYFGD